MIFMTVFPYEMNAEIPCAMGYTRKKGNKNKNSNHGTRNARMAKALSQSVEQYTKDGVLVKVWQSTREVERQLGFTHSTISAVALGKRKTAYGYVWKYIKEEN